MEKSTLYGIIAILLVLAVGFVFFDFNTSRITGNEIIPFDKTIKVYFEEGNPTNYGENGDLDYRFNYWEGFRTENKVNFVYEENKEEADVIVRRIKEYSDNSLGFTAEGKFVDVGEGDSKCDGIWRPYYRESIDKVLIHELGHVLGREYSDDPTDIMYPEFKKIYSFEIKKDFEGYQYPGNRFLEGDCSRILKAKSE